MNILNLLKPLLGIIDGGKSYLCALGLAGLGAWLTATSTSETTTQLGVALLGLSGLGASLRHALAKIQGGLPPVTDDAAKPKAADGPQSPWPLSLLLAAGLALAATASAVALRQPSPGASRSGPHGAEPSVDLLASPDLFMSNTVSRLDRSGMCVNTSIETALRYLGRDDWRGYRDYTAQIEPGGSYPRKVDDQIAKFCKARNVELQYLQVEGPETLQMIELALATGRPVAISDCGNPKRYDRPVPHMTTAVHLDGQYGCIVDNNARPEEPGGVEDWITYAEFKRRTSHYGGWAVIPLTPPPPPIPINPPHAARGREYQAHLGGRDMHAVLFATLLLSPPCRGGSCGAGGCAAPREWGSVAAPQPAGYMWIQHASGDEWALMLNGVQVGGYRPEGGRYMDYRGGRWLAGTCPVPYPETPREVDAGVSNAPSAEHAGPPAPDFPAYPTGVDVGAWKPPTETLVRHNGVPITREAGERMLAAGGSPADKLVDDSQKPRLVVVGGDPLFAAVRSTIAGCPELAALVNERVRYTSPVIPYFVGKGHWHVATVGYGDGVTVTRGPGRTGRGEEVAYWQAAPTAADLLSALRRADPNYKPTPLPTGPLVPTGPSGPGGNPQPAPQAAGMSGETLGVLAVAGVVLLLIVRGQQQRPE